MTPSYWNRQFHFAATLPDFQDCLEQMRRDSIELSLDFKRFNYGTDKRQFVELHGTPNCSGLLPVFIHGGYWRALEAENHRFVLPPLLTLNGAVANLEYRLLPNVTLAEIVADTMAGLQRIAAQTDCRLLVIGHSAGGHLAVTMADTLTREVAGAVAISGIFDLKPLQWSFLKEEVGLTGKDLEGLSPQESWQGEDARQVIVAVGSCETHEFHRQAHMFASTYDARFIEVPDAHHMTVLNSLADEDSLLFAEISALYRHSCAA